MAYKSSTTLTPDRAFLLWKQVLILFTAPPAYLFVHPSKNPGKKVNWRHNIQQNYIQQNDTEYNDIQQNLNIV
jgi:hypothetical protein